MLTTFGTSTNFDYAIYYNYYLVVILNILIIVSSFFNTYFAVIIIHFFVIYYITNRTALKIIPGHAIAALLITVTTRIIRRFSRLITSSIYTYPSCRSTFFFAAHLIVLLYTHVGTNHYYIYTICAMYLSSLYCCYYYYYS